MVFIARFGELILKVIGKDATAAAHIQQAAGRRERMSLPLLRYG
jgi:hypothetical protein